MADLMWFYYCLSGYYGQKGRYAQDILSLRPKHCTCHFEPFGGLFSVGLRSTCPERVYNDLNPKLAGLMNALSKPETASQVLEFMCQTEYSQSYFDYAKLMTNHFFDSLNEITRASLTWYTLLTSFNGLMKDFRGFSMGTEKEVYQVILAKKGEAVKLAEGVQVYNMSAFDIIPWYMDRQDCWTYVDCPYCLSTRKGVKAYECELTDAQQRQLVEMIVGAKGYVAVSGYRNDIYDSVLNAKNGWCSFALESDIAKHGRIGGRGESRSRTDEIIWVNHSNKMGT